MIYNNEANTHLIKQHETQHNATHSASEISFMRSELKRSRTHYSILLPLYVAFDEFQVKHIKNITLNNNRNATPAWVGLVHETSLHFSLTEIYSELKKNKSFYCRKKKKWMCCK